MRLGTKKPVSTKQTSTNLPPDTPTEAPPSKPGGLEQALGPDLGYLARSQWPMAPDPWTPEELAQLEQVRKRAYQQQK